MCFSTSETFVYDKLSLVPYLLISKRYELYSELLIHNYYKKSFNSKKLLKSAADLIMNFLS